MHHPRPLSEGGDHGQVLEVVCRVCHFAEHHKPDPARLAWAKFLQEEFPCLKSIEKALKLSEIREKLNDLNAVTDPTDAQQTEERDLIASQKTTETEYRAALTEEGDEHATVPVDGEDREYRCAPGARQRRAHRVGALSSIAASTAPKRRYSSIVGLRANQIPLDMLRLPVEHRAVTTGPTNVGTTEQPAILPVFASGVGAFHRRRSPDRRGGSGCLSGPRPAADRGRAAR